MTNATKAKPTEAEPTEAEIYAETWEGIPDELRPAVKRAIPAGLSPSWHGFVTARIRRDVARVARLREREAALPDELAAARERLARATAAHRELVGRFNDFADDVSAAEVAVSQNRVDTASAKAKALGDEWTYLGGRLDVARKALTEALERDYRDLVAEERSYRARAKARAEADERAEAAKRAEAANAERAEAKHAEYGRARVAGWTE